MLNLEKKRELIIVGFIAGLLMGFVIVGLNYFVGSPYKEIFLCLFLIHTLYKIWKNNDKTIKKILEIKNKYIDFNVKTLMLKMILFIVISLEIGIIIPQLYFGTELLIFSTIYVLFCFSFLAFKINNVLQ